MPTDLGGLAFRCDLRDAIMREVCFTGRYEPQETALLQSVLRKGMTFVDVGANWGYFTLVAAHLVGSSGRVVSIEADPGACRAIHANIARNAIRHVVVLEMAASDHTGTVWLQQYEEGASESGNYGLTSTTTVAEHGRGLAVTARPLDAALDEIDLDRIDLLKMDIEGAEGRALTGLCRRLSDCRVRQILLEIHPRHLRDQGSSAERVVAQLREFGYEPWSFDHSASATRRMAAGRMRVTEALTPLVDVESLGPWPHLLWTARA
jgi:FkbM family methyltransferase